MTVSTTFVEDASLGSVKITGMVLCVLGVTTHSVMKAVRLRGILRSHHLSYISNYCLYVRVTCN